VVFLSLVSPPLSHFLSGGSCLELLSARRPACPESRLRFPAGPSPPQKPRRLPLNSLAPSGRVSDYQLSPVFFCSVQPSVSPPRDSPCRRALFTFPVLSCIFCPLNFLSPDFLLIPWVFFFCPLVGVLQETFSSVPWPLIAVAFECVFTIVPSSCLRRWQRSPPICPRLFPWHGVFWCYHLLPPPRIARSLSRIRLFPFLFKLSPLLHPFVFPFLSSSWACDATLLSPEECPRLPIFEI